MERMVDYSDQYGGYFSRSDFEEYRPEWVEPIHVNYRGYDIHEIPPNGHGISALMALNILKGFAFDGERESAEVYHKQIEAMKLAYMGRQDLCDRSALYESKRAGSAFGRLCG